MYRRRQIDKIHQKIPWDFAINLTGECMEKEAGETHVRIPGLFRITVTLENCDRHTTSS